MDVQQKRGLFFFFFCPPARPPSLLTAPCHQKREIKTPAVGPRARPGRLKSQSQIFFQRLQSPKSPDFFLPTPAIYGVLDCTGVRLRQPGPPTLY